MRRVVRWAVMIAGTGGVLLAGAGSAAAQVTDWPWDGGMDGVYAPGAWTGNNRFWMNNEANTYCRPHTHTCANGSINSANLDHSQNLWISGNVNDGGSPDNVVDSPNSGNTTEGPYTNSHNDNQHITTGRRR